MFWSKARKLKRLQAELDGFKILAGALEKLRDTAREELHKCQTTIIPSLVAERDQLHRKVDDLTAECQQLTKSHENLRTERLEAEAGRFRAEHPEIKPPSNFPLDVDLPREFAPLKDTKGFE